MAECENCGLPEESGPDCEVCENTRLRRLLTDFVEVAQESTGVIGWHLNGDVAEWKEFEFYAEAEALMNPILATHAPSTGSGPSGTTHDE